MSNDTPSETNKEREILTAKISKESAHGWRKFCADNGISVTAMIEVAGLALAAETMPPSVEERNRMVKHAREIDQARRARK